MPRIIFNSAVLTLLFSTCIVFGQKPVSYLTEPAISPDRKEIAFVSGGDVWTVPAAGGTAQLLISNPAVESRPLYSPDGKLLAFASTRTGNGDIYVLNLENGDLMRLTFDDAAEILNNWSRDGQWLYFTSTSRDISGMKDIYRVNLRGGTPMTVSADRYTSEFQAAPARDGSIAFSARGTSVGQWWRKGRSHIDESEIWLKKGDTYQQITEGGAKQNWTMWSADGAKIYFVSDRTGPQNIWSQALEGQPKQLTTFVDGRVLWASISFDGKQIVFERNFKIWAMNTDSGRAEEVPIMLRGAAANPGNERVNLSTQIREIALSPDGKKIAVTARGEIFAVSAKDGGDGFRVTNTVTPESFAAWSNDSKKVVYASERNGTMQIFQYDFTTEAETQITKAGNDFSPAFSPDGKSLAFLRNGRSLMIYDVNAKQEREICKLYNDSPPLIGKRSFVWSPDNKWIAFITGSPEARSFSNVSIVAATGQSEPQPVSFLANSNTGTISWSPDGSFILFDSSQRTETVSLARIDLRLRSPRFREDQFRDLFKQENPRDKNPPIPSTSPTSAASPAPTPADEKKDNEIVFVDIRQRLSFLQTNVNVGNQSISPDGKTVLIGASAAGQFNFYTLTLDELATDQSARQLTSTTGPKSDPQFSPDGKDVYFLENGRVNIVNLDKRDIRPLAVNIEMNVNFAQEKMEIFKQGWRYLRDNFYDDKYHGADWNDVRTTYEPLIAGARTGDDVRRLMNMMVGELNASHLGVSASFGQGAQSVPVGKLGLRFDRAEFETNGRLRVTEVISLGPADVSRQIKIGDYLLSIDGARLTPTSNIDELLENKAGKRTLLGISASGDGAGNRDVAVKPISFGAEKNLLYRQWVEANRAYVEKVSSGKLGYVHLADMSENSLTQFCVDLDVQNQSRAGVVVDIRNNNGGFINPYVIDVLARKGYLNMTERGGWTVPARAALGQRALERPTILVTNQHSLSDAEDFTEGYRSLKLGKVIGEPTAGWIIFTWNTNLFDGTGVRLPRQGITGNDGQDMELHPRPVDVMVTRPIGETLTGKDSQLDTAVRELLLQIGGK